MAHRCGVCSSGCSFYYAEDIDGKWDMVRTAKESYGWRRVRRSRQTYRHDWHSWKRTTKARKQWARHF